MAGDRALGPGHGGKPTRVQDECTGAIVDETVALAQPVVAGGDAELVLRCEIRDGDGVGGIGRAEHERIGAQAAGERILATSAVDDVGVGVADDRVDLGVAGGADGGRGFE